MKLMMPCYYHASFYSQFKCKLIVEGAKGPTASIRNREDLTVSCFELLQNNSHVSETKQATKSI